ncbi:MAG: ROK family protein [Candidatus Hadarchaeum sp.]|uniref:ROK family protein n=1 Tax=Candidatus Hadarchaeum sp. TaxID=2883567 RepID=UPI0031825C34
MSPLAFGVDIGGTKVNVGLVSDQGRIISKYKEPTDVSSPIGVLNQVCRLIDVQIRQQGLRLEEVLGIGVCLPAVIDPKTEKISWTPPHLPRWERVSFKEFLEARLNRPVCLEYDGHACAYAEQWLGVCRHVNSAVIVVIGTGVGGGLILDGRVYHGGTNIAGAVGWMILNICDITAESAPNRGYVENSVCGSALAQKAQEMVKSCEHSASLWGKKQITPGTVFDAAETGDPLASELVRQMIMHVGVAVANIVSLLNVEMVVIGGGLGKRLGPYLAEIEAFVKRYAQPVAGKNVVIKITQLGDDMGMLGAARAAFLRFNGGEKPCRGLTLENERVQKESFHA